jgi:hypothetical protein
MCEAAEPTGALAFRKRVAIWVMKSHLKQKSPPVAGGQSMIVLLVDQSRHRAA